MRIGEKVSNFTALDQNGKEVSLEKLLLEGPLVLFFYPKAMSPLCTKQSCHFRDLHAEFAGLGANVLGVSADTAEEQAQFDSQHNLNMQLLTDQEGSLAKIFGLQRFGPLPAKRATFVISQDAMVLSAFKSETSAKKHADLALEFLLSSEKS